jgi:hypothetical protein
VPACVWCPFQHLTQQQQNSNLTAELPQLLPDIDAELDWGTAAFGAPPDATNLWVGDERAATTFHKDHVSSSVPCGLGSYARALPR